MSAMSCGLLPPIPDLIPISEFHKNNHHPHHHYQILNNNRGVSECAPCSVHGEVMGEQRSRRTGKQPAIDLIDTSRSRGLSAAPQAPFRKTRPERHRKSDRRREHRSTGRRKRSGSKQRSRSSRLFATSPERPVNPRVNPIFVWVRQEDTHIVDVKCEDYDKRNRILLTKTAQGWRAIPRTETLVPTLKEEDDLKNKQQEQQLPQQQEQQQQQQHRVRKQRKTHKVKRKSTGIQVDEDNMSEAEVVADNRPVSPSWSDPVNVESHLPSHTIHITRKPSPDRNVNSSAATNSNNSVENPVIERNINKSCDVTPLDNLLAVAELEFNHQLQSGEWNKCNTESPVNDDIDIKEKSSDDFIDNIEQLNNFIDSCATASNENETEEERIHFNNEEEQQQEGSKADDCDYNEEDDNNLAMDDILNRLEQSLRSPELGNVEVNEMLNECEQNLNVGQLNIKEQDEFIFEEKQNFNESEEVVEEKTSAIKDEHDTKSYNSTDTADTETLIQRATEEVDCPTDLSTRNSFSYSEPTDDIQPTDLSLPKRKESKSPPPRPSSHSSETIQSPQPSGIPAVPPSPDIFSNANNKSKSIFLESLLTNACQKNAESSEAAPEKEPLDLGNFRKSASPTVTCSEEVKNKLKRDGEPASKKMKVEDITLKKLLDVTPGKGLDGKMFSSEQTLKETSRLLELLSLPLDQDAVAQLNQLLSDSTINIPDPMLVPKDRLSQILSTPGREIPRLLIDRPELRLPQALAFPHLLQDPDILVITLSQLQTIIHKQSQIIPLKDIKASEEKAPLVNEKRSSKIEIQKVCNPTKAAEHKEERLSSNSSKDTSRKSGHVSELASDIDAATNAAFNQMMWLPYLNQLDNSSFANSNEFLKLLTMLPPYSTHTPEMTHLLGMNRFVHPAAFPMQPPFNCNPLEYSTWQEAMLQANLLRPKNQYDMMNPKNFYREYAEKNSSALGSNKKTSHYSTKQMHKSNCPPTMYPPTMPYQNHHSSLLSMSSAYQQPATNRTNIQIPQYNPMLSQRNISNANKNRTHHTNTTTTASNKQSGNRTEVPYSISQSQRAEENKLSHTSSHSARLIDHHQSSINGNTMKMSSRKPYPHYANHENTTGANKIGAAVSEGPKHHHSSAVTTAAAMQPIDLSGSTATGSGKLKVRQHLIDPSHTARLLKQDDVPEVGSTTASIEEMQDAQKYLWHPLFGK